MAKTIGILTGGGDVPGLNPCIKALVYRAVDEGYRVLGIRRGWAGLLLYDRDDTSTHDEYIIELDKLRVRTIDRTGGTFLHTSRTHPGKVKATDVPDFLRDPEHPNQYTAENPNKFDFTPHVLKNLEHLGIDVLVPIGGDDTLSYGARLHEEGVPCVAIPKTMDNDVSGTDYCIGFSTAITRSVGFVNALRTSIGSHERIGVVELFGRYSGQTSLITALLSGVDRAIISEVPFDPERLAGLLHDDKRRNPSHYSIMTISEGAQMLGGKVIQYGQADAYGHQKLGGIGEITADAIKEVTGQHILYQQVGYLMRSGAPDSLDLMVATNYANLAIDLVLAGKSGRLVALREGKYTDVDMAVLRQGYRRVDVSAFYDEQEYRPKIRDMSQKPMFLY